MEGEAGYGERQAGKVIPEDDRGFRDVIHPAEPSNRDSPTRSSIRPIEPGARITCACIATCCDSPSCCPAGSPLMLALSGGQDSMALVGLLLGLRRLHGWRLCLWHGDHRWHGPLRGSRRRPCGPGRWDGASGCASIVPKSPRWGKQRPVAGGTGRLGRAARQEGCGHVVTGHTASDRAETVLLNLARGSHRRGLASLRSLRALEARRTEGAGRSPGLRLWLVRPLLIFSRADTARICGTLGLPIWEDPSNEDLSLARNRSAGRGDAGARKRSIPAPAIGSAPRRSDWPRNWNRAGELLDLALRPLQLHREDGPPALRAAIAEPGFSRRARAASSSTGWSATGGGTWRPPT